MAPRNSCYYTVLSRYIWISYPCQDQKSGHFVSLGRFANQVGTHVCCLLRDRRRAALLFLSCSVESESQARVSLGKPLVSHLRYAFQYYKYDPDTYLQVITRLSASNKAVS